MKTISFAVPCYNSAAYMDKCIESLLACGDDIEIIIVDDGSTKDDTPRRLMLGRRPTRASFVPSIRKTGAMVLP